MKHQVPLDREIRVVLLLPRQFLTDLDDASREKLEAACIKHAEQAFVASAFHYRQSGTSKDRDIAPSLTLPDAVLAKVVEVIDGVQFSLRFADGSGIPDSQVAPCPEGT